MTDLVLQVVAYIIIAISFFVSGVIVGKDAATRIYKDRLDILKLEMSKLTELGKRSGGDITPVDLLESFTRFVESINKSF